MLASTKLRGAFMTLSLGALAATVSLSVASSAAFAQASGKIPDFTSSKFDWSWVRVRADGRNALYGDGWLDPPGGMRGPIKNHPDHPLQGNVDRGPGRQVTLAYGD